MGWNSGKDSYINKNCHEFARGPMKHINIPCCMLYCIAHIDDCNGESLKSFAIFKLLTELTCADLSEACSDSNEGTHGAQLGHQVVCSAASIRQPSSHSATLQRHRHLLGTLA